MIKTKSRASKTFVILNPIAGKSQPDRVRAALDRYLVNYQVYETTGEEHVPGVVGAAMERGFDLMIAAGGDGTVSAVAGGLVRTAIPMGIIPLGTGNMLARELGIPLDLDEALALLVSEHKITDIDVMQAGDGFFVLNMGVGISSLMMRETDRQEKRRLGLAAYVWTGLKQLSGYQPHLFKLTVDNQSRQLRAAEVLVANGGLPGVSMWAQGPEIRPDDGRLNVFVVSARTALDYVRLIFAILPLWQKPDRKIYHLSSEQSVTVWADQSLPVQADGEIIGQTPVQVRVLPNALKVLVPPGQGDTRRGRTTPTFFEEARDVSKSRAGKTKTGTPIVR